jgi:hypothetical protein
MPLMNPGGLAMGSGQVVAGVSCVARATDEDRAAQKRLTSLCSRGRVQSVFVPPVTVVKAFRPRSRPACP